MPLVQLLIEHGADVNAQVSGTNTYSKAQTTNFDFFHNDPVHGVNDSLALSLATSDNTGSSSAAPPDPIQRQGVSFYLKEDERQSVVSTLHVPASAARRKIRCAPGCWPGESNATCALAAARAVAIEGEGSLFESDRQRAPARNIPTCIRMRKHVTIRRGDVK